MAVGSLEAVKLVSDIATNAMTIVAIAIGGLWALRAFYRERVRWPKADLELQISHQGLTEDEQLLHVKVNVQNSGRGRIALQDLRVDIHRVLPLDAQTVELLRQGQLVSKNATEASWPGVAGRVKHWDEEPPEIEPGERDEYCFDFAVPAALRTAFVYAYLPNATRKHRELGWPATALYDLSGEGGGEALGVAAGASPSPRPLRGRTVQPLPRPAGQQAPRPPLNPEQEPPRPPQPEEPS